MNQKILVTDARKKPWEEEYNVENRATAKQEIDEIFEEFNNNLRPGETKRTYEMARINKKVIYFADPMGDLDYEVRTIKRKLIQKGILFNKIKTMDTPPFGETAYDILFFDWGGMMMGNSLMESFCREIIKAAKDYPSKMFIMVSTFTKQAMREALEEFSAEEKLFNIYLDIDKFAEDFNKEDKCSLNKLNA